MFAVVWLVAMLVIYTDSRLVVATGLAIAAAVCWLCANVDSAWAGENFAFLELALSVGFACAYIGLVSSIVLAMLEAGACQTLPMPPRRAASRTSCAYSAARSALYS